MPGSCGGGGGLGRRKSVRSAVTHGGFLLCFPGSSGRCFSGSHYVKRAAISRIFLQHSVKSIFTGGSGLVLVVIFSQAYSAAQAFSFRRFFSDCQYSFAGIRPFDFPSYGMKINTTITFIAINPGRGNYHQIPVIAGTEIKYKSLQKHLPKICPRPSLKRLPLMLQRLFSIGGSCLSHSKFFLFNL